MTAIAQTPSSGAPTAHPELPFIEGRPLCASFNAKLRMVSKDELHNDEAAHEEYSALFKWIGWKLDRLKNHRYDTPEAFIEDIRAFEGYMEKINLIRRLHGLKECSAANLSDFGSYYLECKELPREMHWEIRNQALGRFRRPTGERVLVLKSLRIVNEQEFAEKRLREQMEEWVRIMQHSSEGCRNYLNWLADEERLEARQRLDEAMARIFKTHPAAESDPDDEAEWEDHEPSDGRYERD